MQRRKLKNLSFPPTMASQVQSQSRSYGLPSSSSSSSSSSSAKDDPVLGLFAQARQIFDGCDTLREGYYQLKREEHEVDTKNSTQAQDHTQATQLLHECATLLETLGLPDAKKDLTKEWSYTEAEAHSDSNRWQDVRPWNHTSLPSPYLNASAVPPMVWKPLSLTTTSQPFVACQAPLPSTMPTFFNHILSSGARLIVNLTPVFDTANRSKMRKSHQYWPEATSSGPSDVGQGWSVEMLSEDVQSVRNPPLAAQPPVSFSSRSLRKHIPKNPTASDDDWKIICRRLRIRPPSGWTPSSLSSYVKALYDDTGTAPKHPPTDISLDEGNSWNVTLLHVETWADGGHSSAANFTRLVELVEETQRKMIPASSFPVPPVWVHCSAGIGRTGTLIGGLIARALITSKEPSILETPAEKIVLMIWRYLRERRYGMITTPQQAKMIYDEIGRIRKDNDL